MECVHGNSSVGIVVEESFHVLGGKSRSPARSEGHRTQNDEVFRSLVAGSIARPPSYPITSSLLSPHIPVLACLS